MVKAVIASLNVEKKKRGASETATAEWYKDLKPKPAQDRRGDAGAIDGARQELRPDLPLSALCGRSLRRGRICRLRAVGDAEAVSDAGRHKNLRRRTPEGRRTTGSAMTGRAIDIRTLAKDLRARPPRGAGARDHADRKPPRRSSGGGARSRAGVAARHRQGGARRHHRLARASANPPPSTRSACS